MDADEDPPDADRCHTGAVIAIFWGPAPPWSTGAVIGISRRPWLLPLM